MKIGDFVGKAWQDHAGDAAGVWARLPQGLELVESAADLPGYAGIIVHVSGEHLGRWDEGLGLLARVEGLRAFDASSPEGKAIARSKAVLQKCKGDTAAFERSLEAARVAGAPPAQDRVRVLATAAAAFAGQKRTAEALREWREALALASYGPGKQDPAARALAVTGNNLAVELESKDALTQEERGLLLEAAWTARRFWAIAGSWREAERAEYRLAMSHLKVGEAQSALDHASACRGIVREHGDEPGEVFFAQEALARVRLALGEKDRARTERDLAASVVGKIDDEGTRDWVKDELAKLDASLS